MALGKTVTELVEQCTGPELVDWAAYFDIEPPEEAANWRTAHMIANMARLKGHRVKAKDFMPARRTKRRQSVADQIATFKALME